VVQSELNDYDGQRHQKFNGVRVSFMSGRRYGNCVNLSDSEERLDATKRCGEKIHLGGSEKFLPKFYLDVLQNILGCVKADGVDKPKRLVLRK